MPPRCLLPLLHDLPFHAQVYVVWVGTDSNGEYFTSGNLRFSRFRQFAVGSLFDEAQKEVTAVRTSPPRLRCPTHAWHSASPPPPPGHEHCDSSCVRGRQDPW